MRFQERGYEIPWRTVYEARSTVCWLVMAVGLLISTLISGLPMGPTLWMSGISMAFAIYRGIQSWKLYDVKFSLAGKGVLYVDPDQLRSKYVIPNQPAAKSKIYLGCGFEWLQEQQQRLYDLKKYRLSDFMPPEWFMRLRGAVVDQQAEEAIGAPWIHGVSTQEADLGVPLQHMEGQSLVLGTTGCGKTRTAEMLVSQAIWRGDCVIFIDPKFDRDLCDRMYQECVRTGREGDFFFFHPAFPTHSVRMDPMKNFGKVTELASRIAALLPDSGTSASFQAFAWRAINIIAQGLVEVYEQPSLAKLRQFITGGPESLVEKVCVSFFQKNIPDWEKALSRYIALAQQGSIKKVSEAASQELTAYIHFYESELSNKGKRSEVIDGLMSALRHNREHYGKMISSLLPVMDMLTSSHLGKMLSPDIDDLDDQRPITHSHQIIKSRSVFYMALDSLPDKTVASAIGSITLADLAATAGAIYNYATDRYTISLYVDEAAEVVNEPFLSILERARGAGFRVTVFTQTVSDFVATMGSEDRALQMLGNLNNLIAMRTIDVKTQKYVVDAFGDGYVEDLSYSLGTSASSTQALASFSGAEGVTQSRTLEPLVPSSVMGQLPNFHFFAKVSGGKIIKGRMPLFPAIPVDCRYTTRLHRPAESIF